MSLEGRSASIGVPHTEDPFVFGDPRFSEQQQQQQCRCASATSEAAENGNKCHPRVEQDLSSSTRSPTSRATSPCDSPTIVRIDEASSSESPEKFADDATETIDERSRNDEISTANSTLSLETSSSSSDPDQRIIHGRLTVDNEETTRQRGLTVGGVTRRHHHNNHPHHHHHHHHHHQHQQSSQIEDFSDPNRFDNEARSLREKNRANCAGNDSKIVHTDIDELRRIDDTGPPNVVNYSPGFRNFHHQEHMIVQQQQTPVQRGIGNSNAANAKGNFDAMQVSTGMIAMEKGKCQCHQIQPHQQHQQQPLSHVQQRDQTHSSASPPHHHHHHQQQQLQEQENNRRKFSHQRNQPQQQQQQQNYRHHHYHHPHQHIGQQQQQQSDHQRGQSEQATAAGIKLNNSGTDESDDMMLDAGSHHQPPALPPRPPPRPNRRYEHNPNAPYDLGPNNADDTGCCKKYVVLCCLCGGLSAAVGSLFLAVHAVLSAHTASLALFETVPSYIPGTMLILMGLFTILLARRKHRYGFLMKMCGSVGVVCALVCVLVTVTTTVVHMSRLQGLRECIYTEIARSCTCYGSTQGRVLSDPGVLFEETPHCEVVHGALYDCLRALFGVSVAGILACIFSCMLLYQLLSHEKKKMYWEQLQLRCRSLYGQGGSGGVVGASGGSCGCCNDCGGTSPWWAQTPGNLYTPNPDLAPFRRWRLPWSRSRGPAPTPDSNYGFHTTQSRGAVVMRSSGSSSGEPGDNTPGPYSVLTDESQTGGGAPYSLINSTSSGAPYAACASSVASYSLLENGPPVPAALWGPPPPYSDPNSPARRPIPLNSNEERRAAVTMRSPGNAGTPVNLNNRIISATKRMDNFEAGNCEEYRQRVARPSDNYENTEEVLSSSTDPDIEMGSLHHHNHHHHHHHHLSQQRQQQQQQQQQQDEDGSNKASRRARKLLKGVENGAFQQETGNNSLTKQSESELYFGDVSSCCGPESSFYDLAVEKEQQSGPVETSDAPLEYPPSNRFTKQRLSPKRSPRQPVPLPVNLSPEGSLVTLGDNYPVTLVNSPCSASTATVVDDVSRSSSTRGPYLAPDAQYEVIAQQTRYTYYNTKSSSGTGEQDASDRVDTATSCLDYSNERMDVCGVVVANSKPKSGGTPVTKSPSPSNVATPPSSPHPGVASLSQQRCNNEPGSFAHFRDRQIGHQTRTSEGVCPVNV